MFIDSLSSLSAVLGGLIGGGASLVAAVYTQRNQKRLHRAALEVTRRETIYADFVMHASNLLLDAYVSDEFSLGRDEQRLIGLINSMRLFAPAEVVAGAEAVLNTIVEIKLKPSMELRRLATTALSRGLDPDPILAFSQICRDDLSRVR